jgi:hypothetical protein
MAMWTKAAIFPKVPGTKIPADVLIPFVMMLPLVRWWTFLFAMTYALVRLYMYIRGRSVLWILRYAQSYLRAGVIKARPFILSRRRRNITHWDRIDF